MLKRGELTLKAIIVILISGIVLLMFLKAGTSFGSRDVYYKLSLAKDIALTIDLFYGLPGDIEYTYPNGVSKYNIEIKNNIVSVSKYNKFDPIVSSYSFAGIPGDNIQFNSAGANYIVLSKKEGRITVGSIKK